MAWTKEEIKAYKAKYRKENAEKIKAGKDKYYVDNAEKVKTRVAKYRAENAEKVKAGKAKWRTENAEKEKVRKAKWYSENSEKVRGFRKKNSDELKDVYIKERLRRQGFPNESISPELIELKRITLKTTRLCRQLNN